MSDELKKYLFDILLACNRVDEYTGEKKYFEKFTKSKMLKQAVERNIEIIGEATNKALLIEKNLPITSGRKIVNMRNLLIHAYDSIDDARIWEIVIKHLPVLKTEVEQLLKEN